MGILTFNIFIFYHRGFSTLPNNMRLLFRPISTSEPDFYSIIEKYLYSYGFQEPSRWCNCRDPEFTDWLICLITAYFDFYRQAEKIWQVHSLCNELFRVKPYYKSELRIGKKVLHFIKLIKFESNEVNEDEIVTKALRLVYYPKFVNEVSQFIKNKK